MKREMDNEIPLTWNTTKNVIKGTLLQMDMYITTMDMDNNKDCIKSIATRDQEAINTIWNLAQNTTTSRLEIIQHKQAHIEAQHIGWKKMKPTDIYDWFIRPIERLFAIDMPRGATLLRAMRYPQSAKHLLTFIKRYTGILRGAKINAIYVIEEMS